MKIQKFPSEEEFVIRDYVISNTPVKLVFPKEIGIKWNEENKVFRSSIWTEDGELVSASWKKFTNLGEQPDFEPLDIDGDLEYIQKIDGSLLCISMFKGTLIARTRGTVDASVLENGHELEFLKEKYPFLFENDLLKTEQYSILTEWYSPKNIIVEKEADEPTLWLTGIVKHSDYSYLPQEEVDFFAKVCGLERPKRYKFNTISEMTEGVKIWEKGEGVVIYGNDGQILKKVKSDRYLYLHRLKSHITSKNNLVEFYVDKGTPNYEDFFEIISNELDFEVAKSFEKELKEVCDAGEKVKKFLDNALDFVHDIRKVETRKEQAEFITRNYREKAGIVFSILDNKEIPNKQMEKLILENYESQRID